MWLFLEIGCYLILDRKSFYDYHHRSQRKMSLNEPKLSNQYLSDYYSRSIETLEKSPFPGFFYLILL